MLQPIEINPKTFLREHCELPALPEVIGRLQETLANREINMEEVADLLSGCPALVGQVLKVVNSAYYGLPTEISGVKEGMGKKTPASFPAPA